MTEAKKPKPAKRPVSDPRLLKTVEEKIAKHGLDPVVHKPLTDAIEKDIVAASMSDLA
jgi:hypothetical protein